MKRAAKEKTRPHEKRRTNERTKTGGILKTCDSEDSRCKMNCWSLGQLNLRCSKKQNKTAFDPVFEIFSSFDENWNFFARSGIIPCLQKSVSDKFGSKLNDCSCSGRKLTSNGKILFAPCNLEELIQFRSQNEKRNKFRIGNTRFVIFILIHFFAF